MHIYMYLRNWCLVQIYNFILSEATLRRRLVFKAQYAVKCDEISDKASRASIEAVVVHNFRLIQEICQQGILPSIG